MEDANQIDSTRSSGASPSGAVGAFWQTRTLAELAAEQGVSLIPDFAALLGQGKDLWADDDEFDAFVTDLQERRHEGG